MVRAKKFNFRLIYLSTDYFGTRQIIFGNNMNAIGNHFCTRSEGRFHQRGGQNLMHFYSIHVIAEYIMSGSEIICPYQSISGQNDYIAFFLIAAGAML